MTSSAPNNLISFTTLWCIEKSKERLWMPLRFLAVFLLFLALCYPKRLEELNEVFVNYMALYIISSTSSSRQNKMNPGGEEGLWHRIGRFFLFKCVDIMKVENIKLSVNSPTWLWGENKVEGHFCSTKFQWNACCEDLWKLVHMLWNPVSKKHLHLVCCCFIVFNNILSLWCSKYFRDIFSAL